MEAFGLSSGDAAVAKSLCVRPSMVACLSFSNQLRYKHQRKISIWRKIAYVIHRERYVNDLIARRNDGLIKVVTGIRRCGKSFLLFRLFRDYLLSVDVKASQIIPFAFDNDEDLDLIAAYYPDEPPRPDDQLFDRKDKK